MRLKLKYSCLSSEPLCSAAARMYRVSRPKKKYRTNWAPLIYNTELEQDECFFNNIKDKYHCQNPINPPVSDIVGNKSKYEGGDRNTKRDHQSPDTNVSSSILFEKGL